MPFVPMLVLSDIKLSKQFQAHAVKPATLWSHGINVCDMWHLRIRNLENLLIGNSMKLCRGGLLLWEVDRRCNTFWFTTGWVSSTITTVHFIHIKYTLPPNVHLTAYMHWEYCCLIKLTKSWHLNILFLICVKTSGPLLHMHVKSVIDCNKIIKQ